MDAAIEWCKDNGYTLSPDHFLDEGKSAFKGKHLEADGDLKRFLSLVESGKINRGSALVLESFDRLSRLPMSKAVGLFLSIINSGVGIAFTMTHDKKLITEKTIDAEPYILYAVMGEAQRAYSESKHKSERVKHAHDRRKQKARESGYKTKIWCPTWCDFDKEKGYVVNEERAAIVRRIYDEYLKGIGCYRITRILNLKKIPVLGHSNYKHYRNTTVQWYKKNVRDFLSDRRVYGYAYFLDKEDYYPAIISRETFNIVQNQLALRGAAEPTGGPVEGVSNLFTGIVRCAHCNRLMTRTSTIKVYKGARKKYSYLVCEGAHSGMGCSFKSISYDRFEMGLIDGLKIDTFYKQLADFSPTKEPEAKLESLKGEQVINRRQIEKLTKFIIESENPSQTLSAKLNEFESRDITLAKEIQLANAQLNAAKSIPADVTQVLEQIDELRTTNDGRLKIREALRNMLDRITIDTTTNICKFYFKPGFFGKMHGLIAEEEAEDPETGVIKVNLAVRDVEMTGGTVYRIEIP